MVIVWNGELWWVMVFLDFKVCKFVDLNPWFSRLSKKKSSLFPLIYGLRYFCQIGKLSKNLKAKNRKIVKKNLLNFRGDSHTGKLSKKVHSHTGKLSKKTYGSQPYRKIVKLHFEMIFCRKPHLKVRWDWWN